MTEVSTTLHTLTVSLGERSYPIHIGADLLTRSDLWSAFKGRPIRLITDANVARHYLDTVMTALTLSAEHVRVIPAGEASKTWAMAGSIQDWLLETRLPRDGLLVALGGGVIGDLVGFCAAIYQRGIEFVQVPTTLLAQVDSSVGGKTGVNHPLGKNMIGAFHQPQMVIADTNTLKTLPPRELGAGIAEVIKYGMLGDADFFAWQEEQMNALIAQESEVIAYAVRRSCEMKADIVAQDEREGGMRALLNLGHTFAHAIETYTGYSQWLHGEAVATGLCMAADLSMRQDWLAAADATRCIELIRRAGLPVDPPAGMQPDDFMRLMALDKKVARGHIRLVLMSSLGRSLVTADYDGDALAATLQHCCAAPAASLS